MSVEPERFVKVVPYPKLRKRITIQDDVDNAVHCRICSKGFLNAMALSNHARLEHISAYASGDPKSWTKDRPVLEKNLKTDGSQSSVSTTNPASRETNYIIIKSKDGVQVKKSITEKCNKEVKRTCEKKDKLVMTGPFECLRPSTIGRDGVCHQIFFSCCEYSIHYRDEHTLRRKGLRCQVCEKPLVCNSEQVAPHSCDVCGDGFQTSEELSEHTTIAHVKLKPYKCNICQKTFTQQGGLSLHMRMHTGDRPFPCTFCPKAFTQRSGLDMHLRIHTKVKPYRCVICSKNFCQSAHLRQHMRTHTKVAPFSCVICEKRFKQGSHLNWHLKNHNTEYMTEEQRAKYEELIGMSPKEIVEIEIDPNPIEVDSIGTKVVQQESWNFTPVFEI